MGWVANRKLATLNQACLKLLLLVSLNYLVKPQLIACTVVRCLPLKSLVNALTWIANSGLQYVIVIRLKISPR